MKDAKGHGSEKRGSHATGVNKIGAPARISPTVVAKIKANPGGFSLKPTTAQAPRDGYMVSLPGHTQIVTEDDLRNRGDQVMKEYGKAHGEALRSAGAHIGGWTDSASGKTYLDVSHNFKNRDAAIKAGRARNQIAIWDVKRKREIKTGGTGD